MINPSFTRVHHLMIMVSPRGLAPVTAGSALAIGRCRAGVTTWTRSGSPAATRTERSVAPGQRPG